MLEIKTLIVSAEFPWTIQSSTICHSAEEKTCSKPIPGLSFKYRSVLPRAFQPGLGESWLCWLWQVLSNANKWTCCRSVVSSRYSGFLHQWNWHFIIIISMPWYDPGRCWVVNHRTNQTKPRFCLTNVDGYNTSSIWKWQVWSLSAERKINDELSVYLLYLCWSYNGLLHILPLCSSMNSTDSTGSTQL